MCVCVCVRACVCARVHVAEFSFHFLQIDHNGVVKLCDFGLARVSFDHIAMVCTVIRKLCHVIC